MFTTVLLALAVSSAHSAAVPQGNCKLNSDGFDACIKDYMVALLPRVASEGLPDISLEPLDPLKFPNFSFTMDNALASGKLDVTDIIVHGLGQTEIQSIVTDTKDPLRVSLTATVSIPKLLVSGNHKGEGKISGFQISPDGDFKLVIKNINAVGKMSANVVKKDGKTFLAVDTVDITPQMEVIKVQATGVDKDNADVGALLVKQFNENWKMFYDIVFPIVKPHIDGAAKTMLSKFTDNIPMEQIVVMN